MAITTTTQLAPQVHLAFHKTLLATPTSQKIHKIPAEQHELPVGADTKRYTRYNNLPPSIVPLGNSGVTPSATPFTGINIDAKIDYYGQFLEINEQVTLQRSDPVLNAATIRLGEALRRSEDILMRNMLASTAAFINCVGGVNGDSPTEITLSDVDDVVSALLGADGRTFLEKIEGADKFATAPVKNAYFALAHTSISASIKRVQGFIDAAQYPNGRTPLPSEWGNIASLRFLLSTDGSITPNASGNGADVVNIFCLAQEATACIKQELYGAKLIYNGPELNGPMRLNSTLAYKFAEVPRILNDAWVINARCTI